MTVQLLLWLLAVIGILKLSDCRQPEAAVCGNVSKNCFWPVAAVAVRPISADQTSLTYDSFAVIAVARCCIAIYRSPTHSSHPSIDADDCRMACSKCAAGRDHQVQTNNSLDVRFSVVRAGACDPKRTRSLWAVYASYRPSSVSPGWSSGRRPSGQWNLRSDSLMGMSLMQA